ncbi:MAG: transcription termination/antitermination NusG family protein [Bryobacteraceae bacterium]
MGFEGLENTDWFGIRVRSRCEVRAYDDLCLRGFEAFLPLRSVRRRWSDRVKTLQVPMFGGYLFCRFALPDRLKVLNAAGVAQIVGIGNTPVPISEAEIRSVQTLVTSKVACTPWPYLQAGQRVSIDCGPLAGVEGVIIRAEDGKSRVVVSVTMLLRSIAAEIERDWIGRVQ